MDRAAVFRHHFNKYMRLSELNGKTICILGYGLEGKATEAFLRSHLNDAHYIIADKSQGVDYLELQNGADFVIKSPGISKELVTRPYTTATNLFFENLPQNSTVIGVTGSKGKTTTASLIYQILKRAGKVVYLVGNVGVPALQVLQNTPEGESIFVYELSSYQLDDVRYSPSVAVVTSLFPEHMDYHGSEEEYYAAKSNVVRFQGELDHFFYHNDCEICRAWAQVSKSQKHVVSQELEQVQTWSTKLLGSHNKRNIALAWSVTQFFGVSKDDAKATIAEFTPVSHRLENIGTFAGITFYDDAISTTPQSTLAALAAIPNVTCLMLGGQNRGYDFAELAKVIVEKNIKSLVLFPDSGLQIEKSLAKYPTYSPEITHTSSMQEAVDFAFTHSLTGSSVLLSCASPSYSIWKNFEEKGTQFQHFVKTHGS